MSHGYGGPGLTEALDQVKSALAAMGCGNPEPCINCWADSEDATLFGVWGPIDKGYRRLAKTFRWVAFSPRTRGSGSTGRTSPLCESWLRHRRPGRIAQYQRARGRRALRRRRSSENQRSSVESAGPGRRNLGVGSSGRRGQLDKKTTPEGEPATLRRRPSRSWISERAAVASPRTPPAQGRAAAAGQAQAPQPARRCSDRC
jgi:hypothetical protein